MQRTRLTWLLPLLLIVLPALQADAQTPVDSLKPYGVAFIQYNPLNTMRFLWCNPMVIVLYIGVPAK